MLNELIVLKKLWVHFPQNRKKEFFFLFLLMILGSISEFFSIGLIVPLLTAITNPNLVFDNIYIIPFIRFLDITSNEQLIIFMIFTFILFAVFSGTVRILLIYQISNFSYLSGADLSVKIYSNIIHQDFENIQEYPSNDLISLLTNKCRLVISSVIYPFVNIIASSLIGIFIICLLIIVEPMISLLLLSSFVFLYLIIIKVSRINLLSNSEIISKNHSKLIQIIQNSFGGIRDIIMHSSQNFLINEYKKLDYELQRAEAKNLFTGQSPKYFLESLSIVIFSLVIYFLSINGNQINNYIPTIAIIAFSAQRLLPLIQQIYYGVSSVRGVNESLSDVINSLNLKVKTKTSYNKSLVFKKSIILKNISFKYKGSEIEVLKNINIQIEKGDFVGIIGESGSGKSTLLDIFMGFLTPSSGNVYIDNKILNVETSKKWHCNFSHVPQNTFLIDDSIINNIIFFNKDHRIDDELIKRSIDLACLSKLVDKLPNKILSRTGELGSKLSGGERQRINIARAIYNNSKIFIFDEATSSLDSRTENQIMKNLYDLKKEKTIIMVSHKINTLKNCNKIYRLKDGKLNYLGGFKSAQKKIND